MRHTSFLVSVLVLAMAWASAPCSAQDDRTVDLGDLHAAPSPADPAMPSYEEFRLSQLDYLAGRSRIGVISSSAVAAAGLALVIPAAVGQCVRVASSSSFDDLRCSTTGKALLGVGIPMIAAGVTGLLVTSIMLGVRRGKMRGIEDRLAYERHRTIRWDPVRSAVAF